MAEDFRLSAEPRELLGTLHTRRLRKQGRVPANLYGFRKEAMNISVLAEDVEKLIAGGSKVVDVAVNGAVDKAVVQELQWDVFGTHVRHVDLKRVDPDAVTSAEVPLELRGEPIGLKVGGQIRQFLKTVTVNCPSFRVPARIGVRVTGLSLGDSIRVGDITPPETVKIDTDADTVVVELFDPKKAAADE